MSDQDFVELSMRFRPKVHTPDGILVRYLLSYKPTERRRRILAALRTFYLVAAYGWVSDFEDLDGASEFISVLQKTYGEGLSNIVNDSISLNIDLRIDYMGSVVLPNIEANEGEDKDEYDSDEDEE